MNTGIRLVAAGPGEAAVILEGRADSKGQDLNVAFPQFSTIPVQKILRQETQGNNLVLIMDADQLGDVLEAGSPCQIKIPELGLVQTVLWPVIIGKRSRDRQVVNIQAGSVSSREKTQSLSGQKDPVIEKPDISDRQDTGEISVHSFESNSKEETVLKPEMSNKDLVSENSGKKTIPSFLLFLALVVFILLLGSGIVFWKKSHVHADRPLPAPGQKMETVQKGPVPKENMGNPEKQDENGKEAGKSGGQDLSRSSQSMPVLNLEHLSVQEVLDKAPNMLAITQEGERRLKNGQADDGILLLEDTASKGDVEAMLKLGLLYDPVDFKVGGPIPSPDMREAARYFQKAAQNGSKDVTAPRQALYDWLDKKAKDGDEMARLTLKDFW